MNSWQEEPNCESWSPSMFVSDVFWCYRLERCMCVFLLLWHQHLSLNSWVSLVSKNYEIERAIIQLENEVTQLRQQQGDENKENIRQDF